MYCRQHPETGIVKFEEVCQVDSLDLLEHSMWLDKQTDPRLFRYWKETGLPEYPYFWYVVKVDDGASPMTSVRALLTTGAFVLDQSDIRSMKSILNVSISLGLSSQIAGKATFGECWEFRLRGQASPLPYLLPLLPIRGWCRTLWLPNPTDGALESVENKQTTNLITTISFHRG